MSALMLFLPPSSAIMTAGPDCAPAADGSDLKNTYAVFDAARVVMLPIATLTVPASSALLHLFSSYYQLSLLC
jgi:hypothetical protein